MEVLNAHFLYKISRKSCTGEVLEIENLIITASYALESGCFNGIDYQFNSGVLISGSFLI